MSGMDQLNNTVRKTVAGAGITGICAGVGGLAGGPVGLAVGGTVGGLVSSKVLDFRSAPQVIEYEFTPPERTALVERAKQGLANLADLAIKLFLRLLKEFRNFKSLEDFKRSVLIPLIEELASVGVQKLIKLIQIAFF